MPLQNRVDPFGVLFRSPARGTLMGNRGGALHNEQREIVRCFLNRRWIACALEFRGRKRTVMSPRRYTELFFLDEAVAFAAGHRPCAECRRPRFNAFKSAWARREGAASLETPRAEEIDRELQRSRIDSGGRKVTYSAELAELPEGSMIAIEGSAHLVWDDGLWLWTPEGYGRRQPKSSGPVTVLTPRPVVECFRQGYTPAVHESARYRSRAR